MTDFLSKIDRQMQSHALITCGVGMLTWINQPLGNKDLIKESVNLFNNLFSLFFLRWSCRSWPDDASSKILYFLSWSIDLNY